MRPLPAALAPGPGLSPPIAWGFRDAAVHLSVGSSPLSLMWAFLMGFPWGRGPVTARGDAGGPPTGSGLGFCRTRALCFSRLGRSACAPVDPSVPLGNPPHAVPSPCPSGLWLVSHPWSQSQPGSQGWTIMGLRQLGRMYQQICPPWTCSAWSPVHRTTTSRSRGALSVCGTQGVHAARRLGLLQTPSKARHRS